MLGENKFRAFYKLLKRVTVQGRKLDLNVDEKLFIAPNCKIS